VILLSVIYEARSRLRGGGDIEMTWYEASPPHSDGVEVIVDILGDGVNLGVKLILNLKEVMLFLLGDEVDCQTFASKTP
jgi:hypothetical protein